LQGGAVPRVISKSEFAAVVGVSPSRVSHWLRDGKISGDAVVGSGYCARIDVDLAKAQLAGSLDLSQRLGANGKARLEGASSASPAPSATLDAGIKSARLRQLELSNERAAAEAAADTGRFVEASAAKRELGRVASRLVVAFDGALPSMADALAARFQLPSRDVLHAVRAEWLTVRARLAAIEDEAGAHGS